MAREDAQLKLRLSDDLKQKVVEAAKANGRSVNAEIVSRLEETFGEEQKLWDEVNRLSDLFDNLSHRVSKVEPRVEYLWEKGQP